MMTALIRLQRMRSNGQALNTRKSGKKAVESAVLSGVNLNSFHSALRQRTLHAGAISNFGWEILSIRCCVSRKSAGTGRWEHSFYSSFAAAVNVRPLLSLAAQLCA
jgi:hypothetical protein